MDKVTLSDLADCRLDENPSHDSIRGPCSSPQELPYYARPTLGKNQTYTWYLRSQISYRAKPVAALVPVEIPLQAYEAVRRHADILRRMTKEKLELSSSSLTMPYRTAYSGCMVNI